jgi:glucose uptake protein GlcU
MSLLSGCTDTCGWIAAVLAVFSWGTFGVPVKSNVNVDVNFFVMQSYKTVVCFLTSWLVIFLGEPIRFSPWGIVSGLFWVPGASCGIYAIRNAGIAVSVGTWSSIQVVISCVFGIIIFQEEVKDRTQTMLAFFILLTGLIGMSRYSDPSTGKSSVEYMPITSTEHDDIAAENMTRSPVSIGKKRTKSSKNLSSGSHDGKLESSFVSIDTTTLIPLEIADVAEFVPQEDGKELAKDRVVLFSGRLILTKRQLGVLGAVVNGAWGGLNLIPMHFAKRDQGLSGAGYVISYASGSMLVCILIWIGLFVYYYVKKGYSVMDAVDSLPRWHINELGVPGILAGLLYSIGNFCSILAVSYLGQGVGFSFCQGQLLISGLWGVFFFKEIQGRETILKWFISASITIVGIIYLSYQKGGATPHR